MDYEAWDNLLIKLTQKPFLRLFKNNKKVILVSKINLKINCSNKRIKLMNRFIIKISIIIIIAMIKKIYGTIVFKIFARYSKKT